MDKSWVHMYPCTKEFDDGLKAFIEHAFATPTPETTIVTIDGEYSDGGDRDYIIDMLRDRFEGPVVDEDTDGVAEETDSVFSDARWVRRIEQELDDFSSSNCHHPGKWLKNKKMHIEIFEEKAKLAFLERTRVGKLPVGFRDGVAIGLNSTELSALAGCLGRDANLLPFHFLKWLLVDIEYKDRVMMEIKYVLKQLNAAWKDEKGDLKREYFIPFTTREDRIANRPDKVPEDQWTVLVEYWENPKTLIEEDPERDAPLGIPATWLEIFRKTHTRKDKTPINELT
ncbi:Uncharacterized protein Fot_41903 [Forsythia ovata]|uniref:Uncharacterized protein n=1 Tax=Forsythia ovata TaxID=205694 RepID=A0ABD1RKD8_9LAMI